MVDLLVSNRLPKDRLGHYLTSLEVYPERKNTGKYKTILRQNPPWSSQ